MYSSPLAGNLPTGRLSEVVVDQSWPGPKQAWTRVGLNPSWPGPELARTQVGLDPSWPRPELARTRVGQDPSWYMCIRGDPSWPLGFDLG